jgi:hypothetical protein
MIFRVDKNKQLRISDMEEIKITPEEPDTIILSAEETEYLLHFLISELG